MNLEIKCPICSGQCCPLDVVDFNKSCEEHRGIYLPLSGIPIYYYLCNICGYCFAPEINQWNLVNFKERIYNDDYILVDPDYLIARPTNNADVLGELFGGKRDSIRHLDYGGGNGLLSKLLCDKGWKSKSYDPFVDQDTNVSRFGKFDLITVFEVFEHVPDIKSLMANLSLLLDNDGIILFTTLISDNKIMQRKRITWWYASPRNGHIGLFSKASLQQLAIQAHFNFCSFSDGFHAFWKTGPSWASHLITSYI